MADTSIYRLLRPMEHSAPYSGALSRGLQVGMKMRQLANQEQAQERENELQDKAMVQAAEQKRLNTIGRAVHGLAALPEQERAARFPIVRKQLIDQGYPEVQNVPEQYDPNLFGALYSRFPMPKEMLEERKAQAEIAKLNAEAKRKEVDPNLWWKQEQREMARQKNLDSNVGKLQDNLGNSQEAVRSIKDVESTLGFQLEDYNPKKDDLPGVSVPGLGRFTGFSGEARDLNSSMSKIFNTVLKDRSGAAVTTPELDRLRDEFNTGKYNTEQELISAAKRYKAGVMAKMRDIEAGANPDAVAEYRNRRGTTSQDLAYREGERKQGGQQLDKYGANAGAKPTPPPGMVLMRAPNGKMKYVSEAQKGEAIAAGGEVVK